MSRLSRAAQISRIREIGQEAMKVWLETYKKEMAQSVLLVTDGEPVVISRCPCESQEMPECADLEGSNTTRCVCFDSSIPGELPG